MVISKVMVLVFSESEEYIFNKVKEIVESETEFNHVEAPLEPVLSFQGLEIHLRNEMVRLDGKLVELSHQEFLTLKGLARHPGWVFSKEQIYEMIGGNENTEDIENSVYCLIRKLRKKLESDPQQSKYIKTVRGVGYKFVIPEE